MTISSHGFETFLGVRAALKLRDGRTIVLQELRQSWTYAGLAIGRPTAELNRLYQSSAVTSATKSLGTKVLLIAPATTPGRPGTEEMPAVRTFALFTSHALPGRTGQSCLGLVWFSAEFGLPEGPAVLDRLVELDWDRHAVEHEE